jgi:hypothetical protein
MLSLGSVAAQESQRDTSHRIAVELGTFAFARNDVRVPSNLGTEFDMVDVVGSKPESFLRINAEWNVNRRHSVGLVVAPLKVSGAGRLAADTSFSDERFASGPVYGEYRFNIYKISYRYALAPRGDWQWKIGFTGLIRDANIALRQGDIATNYDNIGFAPLFHIDGKYPISDRWLLHLDFDGLAGGPGRAFDVALKATYDVGDTWQVGAGYRLLEGGVDTDDVYNFAWNNYLILEVGYRF